MPTRPSTTLTLVVAALAGALALPAAAGAARYGSRTLASGMRGDDVRQLQRYLKRAGHRVGADGAFGQRTARALRASERELELRADAIATPREQRLIRRAGAGPARYGSRTLASGMRGGDVKRLQRYLKRAGHRVGADGDFGPRTARALRATERELELRADAIATRREQRLIRRAVAGPGTGGSTYRAPPRGKLAPGAQSKLTAAGFAIAPATAPERVKQVVAAANRIAKTPYKWGGGHGAWEDAGYDCSGSVSYALHGGGLLASPLVSGGFARWGASGRGSWITIYAHGTHVYMVVAGLRYDTSARSRTGSRWTSKPRSPAGFAVTHPAGL